VAVQAAVRGGTITGVVRDDRGQSVAGVAVTAIGTIQAQARTDAMGVFQLALVPGDYVIRATHDGYVCPYKEWVRVGNSARLERNITITKQAGLPERTVLLASMGLTRTDELGTLTAAAPPTINESLQAWYLRHLPRTILRDGSGSATEPAPAPRSGIRNVPSFLDWVVAESAQAATSFFADTNFSGQVNVLTTSASSASQGWLPDQQPRGIAYLAVGAPVGRHGDWRLRGALSTGSLASWVALGEYEARDVRTHAFRMGMSYGSQRAVDQVGAAVLKASEPGRSVASVHGRDRWRVRPGLEIDYGLRVDHYDYVEGQSFISPRVGLRLGMSPRTFVTGSASRVVIAPGADEFLPPPTSGPWLPPERTFASLVPGTPFRSESVERYQVGLEHDFGVIGQSRTVGVRWFHETSQNQLATMFGLNRGGGVGHYYVATPGDVTLEGWAIRVDGYLTPRIKASLDYSISQAQWTFGPEAARIAHVMASAVRPQRERLHDVTSTFEASIAETDTHLLVAYRLNSALTKPDDEGLGAFFSGRFDVQLRQALPMQPINGGRIEFMASVSNLFRDPRNAGSFYDELLTVRTPRRILGGVQVRF
jgi:hypothetical protein